MRKPDLDTEHAGKLAQIRCSTRTVPCEIVGTWQANYQTEYSRVRLLASYGVHRAGDVIDIHSDYIERLEA